MLLSIEAIDIIIIFVWSWFNLTCRRSRRYACYSLPRNLRPTPHQRLNTSQRSKHPKQLPSDLSKKESSIILLHLEKMMSPSSSASLREASLLCAMKISWYVLKHNYLGFRWDEGSTWQPRPIAKIVWFLPYSVTSHWERYTTVQG